MDKTLCEASKYGIKWTWIPPRTLAKPKCADQYRRDYNSFWPTLAALAPFIRKGRFILTTRDHAVAIIDGQINDNFLIGARTRINGIRQITNWR